MAPILKTKIRYNTGAYVRLHPGRHSREHKDDKKRIKKRQQKKAKSRQGKGVLRIKSKSKPHENDIHSWDEDIVSDISTIQNSPNVDLLGGVHNFIDNHWSTLAEKFKKTMVLNKELIRQNDRLRSGRVPNFRASSTVFPDNDQSQQLFQMLSDTLLNRQSPIIASAISPCVPQEGGEIQITDWECWKRRF